MLGYFEEAQYTHIHASRSATNGALTLLNVHNDGGRRTVKYDGEKTWNDIPGNVRNIDEYQQFKKLYKQF